MTVRGDVLEVLLQDASGVNHRTSADLETGDYTILARWSDGDTPRPAGRVHITQGESLTLRCEAGFYQCRR